MLLPITAGDVVDNHTARATGVYEHVVLKMYADMSATALTVGGGKEQKIALLKIFFADSRTERRVVLVYASAWQLKAIDLVVYGAGQSGAINAAPSVTSIFIRRTHP